MILDRPWAPDFVPHFTPMSEEQTKLFMVASMLSLEKKEDPIDSVDRTFLIQVLMKRIEVMKLPISFSTTGKMAVLALVDIPGALVALLIDCLNAYEGKTVGPDELAELYPSGFYTQESLEKYVDFYLKTKKVKWAEVY